MIRRGRPVVWLLLLLLAACSPTPNSIDYTNPEQRIQAVNLVSNYVNHPNVADRDHTGKVIEVSGRVMRMEREHVVIGSAEKGEVWLAFEGGSLPQEIQAGQEITVVGECKGKNGHVLMEKCRLTP